MKKYIVDRIEYIPPQQNTATTARGFAVCECEDGTHIDLPLSSLPHPLHEGDILLQSDNGNFEITQSQTQKRRQELFNLAKKLTKAED